MAPIATQDLSEPSSRKHVHILIVGAGLTGLILAQGLRKFNASPAASELPVRYTFSIHERDPHLFARGAGYSLSIHWALSHLQGSLPDDVLAGLDACVVNPHAHETGQDGNFQYINYRNGVPVIKFSFDSLKIARVSREKIIRLLATGLEVQFNQQLSDVSYPNEDDVIAHFEDGTSATGNFLVGADGVRSKVRKILCGPKGENKRLPVRMLGLRCHYPVEKVKKCQDLDPNFFHGGDPDTNTYAWFSFIDMPRPDSGRTVAECQMTMSWPYEDGYLNRGYPTDVPSTKEGKLAWMRERAAEWVEPMREMVMDLPEDVDVREINLEDWLPEKGGWDNHNGRITIVGDAAHAMTICTSSFIPGDWSLLLTGDLVRGEAANHGIVDVVNLLGRLTSAAELSPPLEATGLHQIVTAYEDEMVERTRPAAVRAHKACLDANHFDRVQEGSFFLTKRQMKDDSS